MQSKAVTVKKYLEELPEDRKEPIKRLRQQILDNLPKGVEEAMSYGMLGYVIPHSVYPDGYHCNPKLPLPFMNLASQKNFVAVYSMVLYAKPEVMDWFVTAYAERCKYKLDMGKSCIRFKRMDDIPYELIGELTAKVDAQEWIDIYERSRKKHEEMKNRVTGIGGLFFKSKDPKAAKAWYKKHLGFNTDDYGCTFWWKDKKGKDCSTQWSPFPEDTSYYEPSKKEFMFNYRVENLSELLAVLKEEGVTIIGDIEEYDYGKFGWILDNDGNKIELWEPIDDAFL